MCASLRVADRFINLKYLYQNYVHLFEFYEMAYTWTCICFSECSYMEI